MTAPTLTSKDVLTSFDFLGIGFTAQGEKISLRGPLRKMGADLNDAVKVHKPELLRLCALRDDFKRLHERIIRSRCEHPPKVSHAKACAYYRAMIDKLADRCDVTKDGVVTGFSDPSDVFSDGEQLTVLRAELDELTAEGNPYPVPLPDGCTLLPQANFDPFEHGRLYNGKLFPLSVNPDAVDK